ncbi:MAG: hypothetical protein EBU36_07785 [Verrucomicrobia bacterium]|nr:hypothetical protein [Verrucomicrobiota bacterium]
MRNLLILCLLTSFGALGWAETYDEYVARHRKNQKLLNPMNVPVANVLNDQWSADPEYANPNNRVSTPGPKVFYIKSSRDDHGRVTRIPAK